MRSALVLGATGFIGGHIAKAALAEGWTVRGLRRDPNATGHLDEGTVQWVNGDLQDQETLLQAMQRTDIVFHAAGFYPKRGDRRSVKEQIEGAREEIRGVIGAARQADVTRFVYTSSLSTIGKPPAGEQRLADERDFYQPGTLPRSAYYEAKIAMEAILLKAAREGFPAVVLNPTAVFGPGDVHLTLGGVLLAAARGGGIAWLPGTVNVVDVRDVAAAHVQAAKSGKAGERYIIGGRNLSIREALTRVAKVAEVSPPRFEVPQWALDALVAVGDALPFLPIPLNHLRAARLWQGYNTEKAQRELGLKPRPFEETVREALAWFGEEGYF